MLQSFLCDELCLVQETLLIQLVSARSQQLGSEGAGAVPGRTLHSDLRTLVLEDSLANCQAMTTKKYKIP